MATYVIGDVHGCFLSLQALMSRLPFEAARDHLWLVGDLVNRGPHSLQVLRWANQLSNRLGQRFVAVLGNHDLHLLALAGGVAKTRSGDTLAAVLDAEDCAQLLHWLRRRPLLHEAADYALVHAGLMPHWSLSRARRWARHLEQLLRDGNSDAMLLRRQAPEGPAERDLHRALTALTRLRMLHADGQPCAHNGPPDRGPAGCQPWFRLWLAQKHTGSVVFGHWAALGVHLEERVMALDSGCAWGGHLSALRLEDRSLFQVPVVPEEGSATESG